MVKRANSFKVTSVSNKFNIKSVSERVFIIIALAIGFCYICTDIIASTRSDSPEINGKQQNNDRESLIPSAARDLSTTHFTWGAELGSSIDLGGNDMSSFDALLMMGYKNQAIQLLGVGVGIRRSFGSQNTFIPLIGVIRTSFRKKPSLLFMHFDAGYSFNSIANSHIRGDICGSLGLGFNLSMNRKFMSHIIIAYGFQHFDVKHRQQAGINSENVPLAQLSFGISF